MVGGTFVSVGDESLNIQDIKVGGNPDDGGAWIKWWDPVAKKYMSDVVYTSELYDAETDEPLGYGGWGDSDYYPIEKTFAPGEGFWWGVNKDNCNLIIAGQIAQPATEYIGSKITTANQQKMVINPFPMNLDIQSIKVDGNPDDGGTWIKWWDAVAKKYMTDVVYTSELYDAETDEPLGYGGWGDSDYYPIDKTFAPCEGFWWGVNKDNCTLLIKNPFYTTSAE